MAKFSFSIDTDSVVEAQQIAENMADLAHFLKSGKKSLGQYMRKQPKEVEFTIVNPQNEDSFSGNPTIKRNVVAAVDKFLDWMGAAPSKEALMALLKQNQHFLRGTCTRDQQNRLQIHAERRERALAEEAKTIPEPIVQPPLDQVLMEFRSLFDAVGQRKCQELLKTLKVAQLKDLPENRRHDALQLIRSAMVAHRVTPAETQASTPTP